jgi:putative selenium metabolism hydrolase
MLDIEKYRNGVVKRAQDLIKIPSITGDEKTIARFVFDELRSNGVDDTSIDEMGNVLGIIHGTGKGPNIMFTGHLDVVPAGNLDEWKGYEPFGGDIDKHGYIHGRGASDLKGGMSVILEIMKLLAEAADNGISLSGDVIFSAVVHEEAAEMLGMEYLCNETLPKREVKFDVVYLYEATDLDVFIGHRGKVELVVNTKGKMVHSSTPWEGINALEKMLPVMDTIFGSMSRNCKVHPMLGKGSITITNILCKPGTLSIVPDECEISIDRRYVPGENLSDIINDFKKAFTIISSHDPDFNASIRPRTLREKSYTGVVKEVQKHHPPWITDLDNRYVQQTLSALKKAGQRPKIGFWKGGTDGSMTGAVMGIPTIGYSGMEEKYAHTYDDKVDIKKLMLSLEGYLFLIGELFGVEPKRILQK